MMSLYAVITATVIGFKFMNSQIESIKSRLIEKYNSFSSYEDRGTAYDDYYGERSVEEFETCFSRTGKSKVHTVCKIGALKGQKRIFELKNASEPPWRLLDMPPEIHSLLFRNYADKNTTKLWMEKIQSGDTERLNGVECNVLTYFRKPMFNIFFVRKPIKTEVFVDSNTLLIRRIKTTDPSMAKFKRFAASVYQFLLEKNLLTQKLKKRYKYQIDCSKRILENDEYTYVRDIYINKIKFKQLQEND